MRSARATFRSLLGNADVPTPTGPGDSVRSSRIASLAPMLAAFAAGSLAVLLTSFLPIIILAAIGGISAARRRSRRRRDLLAFDNDYPAFLIALGSSVRSGLDPLVAIFRTGDLFEPSSVIRREISLFRELVDRGYPESEAIASFAAGIDHQDVALFRSALSLSRQHGSSLSEPLRRLAKVTRQRQSFRRRVRSALAMQRLSAYGISVATIIILVIQVTANREAIWLAFASPLGQGILGAAGALIGTGLGWMLYLSRERAS